MNSLPFIMVSSFIGDDHTQEVATLARSLESAARSISESIIGYTPYYIFNLMDINICTCNATEQAIKHMVRC